MLRPKNVVLFQENYQVKIFLSVSRPHSRMCIRIYTFNFKKNKQTKKKQEYKKRKKGKENISRKSIKKLICG